MNLKNEIEKIVSDNGILIKRRITESYFKKNYPEMHTKISESYDDSLSFGAKLYLLYHEINKKPTCVGCGNNVAFLKFNSGFSKHCSNKCVGLDKNIQIKKENTMMKNYGAAYVLQSTVLRKKIKQTNLERYGNEIPQQVEEIKEKSRETSIKNYGVTHHLKLESQREKVVASNMKKYGVGNVNQSKEVREKSKNTLLKKYGVDSPMKNEEIKNKVRETNLKKYGVEHAFQNKDIKNKIIDTNMKKYGFPSYCTTEEFKIKVKNTKRNRYGDENFNNRKKAESTSLKKYGVSNPSKTELVKNKITMAVDSNYCEKYSKLLSINSNNIIINGDFLTIKNYCKIHNSFEISKSLLYSRVVTRGHENICTGCNPVAENSSIVETELMNFITSLNIKTVIKSTNILKGDKEIDAYMPDYKLGVEFNGLYWHSELFKKKNYHLDKTEECENLEIQLLHIFEDEWTYKKDIVKSIIRNKLGITSNKIFARKCQINEIDNNICSDFLNKNHIQGNVGSLIKLGLYYSGELVSVMTFEIARKGLGNQNNANNYYNLNRFCNKLDTQIIGGASKLLKYFINKYQPQAIITYANRRYSRGNLYKRLGFSVVQINGPTYTYVDPNKKIRYHRFKYRNESIINLGWYVDGKSHSEIMLDHKLYKIYDCGTIKYQMNF